MAAAPQQTPWEATGKGFIAQFYPIFGTNRAQCAGVYRDSSLMTYQGKQMQGVTNIMQFFNEQVTFTQAQFTPEDIDCHPTQNGGVLAVATGYVQLDSETRPIKFSDTFHLSADAQGQWYVANQIFRTLGSINQQ